MNWPLFTQRRDIPRYRQNCGAPSTHTRILRAWSSKEARWNLRRLCLAAREGSAVMIWPSMGAFSLLSAILRFPRAGTTRPDHELGF